MIKSIIDTGPLVALFAKDDKYHQPVINFFKNYNGQLYSTWPVLTEVCHLLSSNLKIQIDFIEWVSIGGLEIVELPSIKINNILKISKKYIDIPMDLADASLVIIAEELNILSIITIDSDYDIYRIFNKQRFNNLLKEYIKK